MYRTTGKNLPEQILLQFQLGVKELPEFKKKEKKIFLQLQKYNLLYATPEGIFKLTKKGEEALKGDVEKHIILERFEEKLIKDSFKEIRMQKIIFFILIPLILLMVIALIIFSVLQITLPYHLFENTS